MRSRRRPEPLPGQYQKQWNGIALRAVGADDEVANHLNSFSEVEHIEVWVAAYNEVSNPNLVDLVEFACGRRDRSPLRERISLIEVVDRRGMGLGDSRPESVPAGM